MQVDTGADSTVISSKIWTELGKPQLDGKIRHLEAHEGHQLTLLGSLTCVVDHLHVKLIPGTQPMFCKARKTTLPLQDKVKEKLEQMVRQGIIEPVQPGGVTNASPVVWQKKKSGELRLCVDLKVHINGKVMDEDYPIPDMETIFHNLHGVSYFGKIDLSDAYYQTELDEEVKDICTIRDCSRCADYLRD